MKMKMKALVAVTAMAIGAQAQAAINSDAATVDGSGELFLSVVDRGPVPKSYILDLGVTAATFLASDSASYSLSFAADSNLTSFLASATGTVSWNLAAGHAVSDWTSNNYGYMSTAPTALIANTNTPQGFTGIGNALGQIDIYTASANLALTGAAKTDMSINTSVTVNSSSNAFYDFGTWGDTWSNSHSTEATLGSSMAFYLVAGDYSADPEAGNVSRVQQFSGEWTLASNGLLTYSTATPPTVPVPAAVWLLGSALIGMVGVARRKSEVKSDEQA